MSAPLEVSLVVNSLGERYGDVSPFGRSRLFKCGSSLCCSINYSKLLRGSKYFFGLSKEVVDPTGRFPDTEFGDFVLLVCGTVDAVLVLPRPLVLRMMEGVGTRRVDVFVERDRYVLQTTGHPKLDVTEHLNAYPSPSALDGAGGPGEADVRAPRDHVSIQWALIRLGRAAGHSVWVPPGDRGLGHGTEPFSAWTMDRLPRLGFDEVTRRVVQNIDVLWLDRSAILKAFEIESTTTIYSGLLRLNDLVLAQPNNRIDLYLAAGNARRDHVARQLLRPSFRPLLPRCTFLGFDHIREQAQKLDSLAGADGLRVSGLLAGERFEVPDHVVYPPE